MIAPRSGASIARMLEDFFLSTLADATAQADPKILLAFVHAPG